jgi:endonuclease YncB( thermonuclease family)
MKLTMHLGRRLQLALLLLPVTLPAHAQTVLDGNTIVLEGRHVRIWGINAPVPGQTCGEWPAGQLAATALGRLVTSRTIACKAHGLDPQGGLWGKCRAGGVDVGATMVREGWAWADVKHTRDYVDQEVAAKAEGLGIHAHACQQPVNQP